MRYLLIFLILLFGVQSLTAQKTLEYGGLTWYLNYDEAKSIAQKENKAIVILFTGSDWCPPCKALKKEVFSNRIFQQEAEKVVLVLADFPRRKKLPDSQMNHNRTLATLFLGRSGLPTMVAIDSRNDEVIRKITGYNFYKHDIQPHLNFIRFVIKKYNGQ